MKAKCLKKKALMGQQIDLLPRLNKYLLESAFSSCNFCGKMVLDGLITNFHPTCIYLQKNFLCCKEMPAPCTFPSPERLVVFKHKKKEKSHPTLYLKVCVVYMFKNQSRCSRLKQRKKHSAILSYVST